MVLDIDPQRERIYLTHKELLGTWAENVRPFHPGHDGARYRAGNQGVRGPLSRLTPNLSGLAEARTDLHGGGGGVGLFSSPLPPTV